MNAIEICGLCKNFKEKQAVCGLDMTVPKGAIYGLIGENGSGKSTTEKMISGLLLPSRGSIRLFDQPHTDAKVRSTLGVLIEAPGCFPTLTVWENMKLQAENLGIANADQEIVRLLKLVRMEGAASNQYRNCSLGMKQRIGIAMALLGHPQLLILDEPINGLDADGMRIVRRVLVDLASEGVTILISSHILGELEKIATHYGILRGGKMLREMTAEELSASYRTYTVVGAKEGQQAKALLQCHYERVEEEESGRLRVYDTVAPEEIAAYLYDQNIVITEMETGRIGLEEYYLDLMKEGK